MKKQSTNFWNQRGKQLLAFVLLGFLSWLLFLRVTDTGSLQQWGLLIVLVGLAVNRLYVAAFPRTGSKP